MKTRNSEPVITTYVEVENSSVDLLLKEGFPWGAGTNVCFRCGDGASITCGCELKELRLVSLPSELNYEIVSHSDEEYEVPRDTGLDIEAVLLDVGGTEYIVNVTAVVTIAKINEDVLNGVIASWSFNGSTKTITIPIVVTLINIDEISRRLVDFSCTYKTTEFVAESNGRSYDVKIYKDNLNPEATYHVEHSNGVESDVTITVFECENSSSSGIGPYITEFENGNDFIISTLRGFNDNQSGFRLWGINENISERGGYYIYGPQIDGTANQMRCGSEGDYVGDLLCGRYWFAPAVRGHIGGISTVNFGECFGTTSGYYLLSHNANTYTDGYINFSTLKQLAESSDWHYGDTHDVIYLKLGWRRREFCTLTLVDNGVVSHTQTTLSAQCVSPNPIEQSRLYIWMPFIKTDEVESGKMVYVNNYFGTIYSGVSLIFKLLVSNDDFESVG